MCASPYGVVASKLNADGWCHGGRPGTWGLGRARVYGTGFYITATSRVKRLRVDETAATDRRCRSLIDVMSSCPHSVKSLGTQANRGLSEDRGMHTVRLQASHERVHES